MTAAHEGVQRVDAPVRVAIEGPRRVRRKALWVLEALLGVGDVAWTEVEPGDSRLDIGYGCVAPIQLTCDEDAWSATSSPPTTADELAYAFWWLARVEEMHLPADARDTHGRFPESASARHAVASTAPVDDLALRLLERLDVRPAPWAGDHRFALALSHDIDTPVRWTRQGVRRAGRRLRDSVRAGRWRDAARVAGALAGVPWWRLRRSDPHRNERAILDLEATYGGRSTFYLMAGHHHQLDGSADAYDRVRSAVAGAVRVGGGELGLHGSYTVSDVPARLVDERLALEDAADADVRHHRHHFLRHAPPGAWVHLERAGMRTDCSLGYAEQAGFRSGFSYPYRAWDYQADRPLNLLLVPLGLMDATLDDDRYLGLSPERARGVWGPLLDHAARHGSGFSVLWHNDRFYSRMAGGWDVVYRDLLAGAVERGAWLGSVGDIAASWQARLVRAEWSDGVAVALGERSRIAQ